MNKSLKNGTVWMIVAVAIALFLFSYALIINERVKQKLESSVSIPLSPPKADTDIVMPEPPPPGIFWIEQPGLPSLSSPGGMRVNGQPIITKNKILADRTAYAIKPRVHEYTPEIFLLELHRCLDNIKKGVDVCLDVSIDDWIVPEMRRALRAGASPEKINRILEEIFELARDGKYLSEDLAKIAEVYHSPGLNNEFARVKREISRKQ